MIVRRWQEWSGKQALRESDGIRFDDLVGTADAADASDVMDAEEAL